MSRRRPPADPTPLADLARLAAERGGKVLGVAAPPPQRRSSKYRNVRTEYDGMKFDSKAEAAHARKLDELKAAGIIRGWTRQVPFRLGCPENRYVVDFLVFTVGSGGAAPSGCYAVDVKGVETAKFKKDKRLWKRYGPIPLHVVAGRKVEVVTPEGLA